MTTASTPPATVAAPAATTPPATSAAPGTSGVEFGAPASGSPAGAPAAQGTPTPSDPWAGLTAENLQIVKNKNWSDLNAAVKSYAELERASSSRPAAPAVPTEIAAYNFGKPDGLPDGVQYSEEFASTYKNWAFENKVPVEYAKSIHDSFVKWSAEQTKAAADKFAETIAHTKSDLTKAWGPENGAAFARQLELSVRAANKLGVMDDLKTLGVIADVNGKSVIANSRVAKALAAVGNAMFAEDTIHGEQAATINPFDPKTENATLAGEIYKNDPHKAKALIYAAGQQQKFAHLLANIR